MKILHVCPEGFSCFGGIQTHILNLSEFQKKQGHDVSVLTLKDKGNKRRNGYPSFEIGRPIPINVNGSITRINFGLISFPKVKSLLEDKSVAPDILHIHNPFAPRLAWQALKYSKAVNIATFHLFGDFSIIQDLYLKFSTSVFCDKLHGRIAVSDTAGKMVRKYIKDPFTVIPNGVNVEKFEDAKPLEKYRDGKINILFVGRFNKRKGVEFLVKAFDNVVQKEKNVRLMLVGKGDLSILQTGKREKVLTFPNVSDDDLPRYYKTADIFCAPSYFGESFGIILLEAMAAGLPVIAGCNEGYKELLDKTKAGILLDPRDIDYFAEVLLDLINDSEKRKKMREVAQEAVRPYDWENVAKRIEEFYIEIIKKNKEEGIKN